MKRFKVKILDHEMRYEGKRGIPVRESTNNVLFINKKDAWEYFYSLIGEHAMGRDFWGSFSWDDKIVETINWDEAGYCNGILYKWEGFDEDIELGWEYEGVVYHSLKELYEAHQCFDGQRMETDEWFIRGKNNEIAHIHVKIINEEWLREEKERMPKKSIEASLILDAKGFKNFLETLDEVCEMSDAECALMDEEFEQLEKQNKLQNIFKY